MNKLEWSKVTKNHVVKAIKIYDNEDIIAPKAKSTFLKYNGRKYPAKHIRGMAYEVAFGKEISKDEYSGGIETVHFFEKLGFEIQYTGPCKRETNDSIKKNNSDNNHIDNIKDSNKIMDDNTYKIKIPSKNVIEQKNALQLLLNRYFNGDIVCEKTFPWMKTPSSIEGVYEDIFEKLSIYRNDKSFAKKNVSLRCDFVCSSKKVIIEYDERQHFTTARKIAIEAYKDNIAFRYDYNLWIKACSDIKAKDNNPINRDEIRAYYDSVRDIEAYRNGYTLIRIMHGQADWSSEDAYQKLDELLCKYINKENINEIHNCDKNKLNVLLYLQDRDNCTEEKFYRDMGKVKKEKPDLLVFPENCYVPFKEKYFNENYKEIDEYYNVMRDEFYKLSKEMQCPVIFSDYGIAGDCYSFYVNPLANDYETKSAEYIKHIVTDYSAFDMNYSELKNNNFSIILLKNFKLGMTICADCNEPLFSREYGKKDVDIIINSSGGNVVYRKWYKYNKVRAIENNCFHLCTMGYTSDSRNPSYTFGFTPNGGEIIPSKIIGDVQEYNKEGNLYLYEINKNMNFASNDIDLDQIENRSKHEDYYINPYNIADLINKCEKVYDDLYINYVKDETLVICIIHGKDIFNPELIAKKLYSPRLSQYDRKRYLLINVWDEISDEIYKTKISDIIKVRTVENFIASILISPKLVKCYQAGKTKNVQVIKISDKGFGLDFGRMGGPETIWRKCEKWRASYEMLI